MAGSRTTLGLEEEFELRVSLWAAAVLAVSPICALASLYKVARLPGSMDTQGLEVATSAPNLEGAEGSHRGHAGHGSCLLESRPVFPNVWLFTLRNCLFPLLPLFLAVSVSPGVCPPLSRA